MYKRAIRHIFVVYIILLVWFVASWYEVIAFNLRPAPEYHTGNFFVVVEQITQD